MRLWCHRSSFRARIALPTLRKISSTAFKIFLARVHVVYAAAHIPRVSLLIFTVSMQHPYYMPSYDSKNHPLWAGSFFIAEAEQRGITATNSCCRFEHQEKTGDSCNFSEGNLFNYNSCRWLRFLFYIRLSCILAFFPQHFFTLPNWNHCVLMVFLPLAFYDSAALLCRRKFSLGVVFSFFSFALPVDKLSLELPKQRSSYWMLCRPLARAYSGWKWEICFGKLDKLKKE